MISTSGSRCAAMAKPSRAFMPGGVALDRRVDELADAGEVDDLVELARDLGALHAHDRALQVDVLAAGQVGMEAGGDLDQRADAAADLDAAARRPQDPRQQLERRRLAGAVRADDAERLARRRPRTRRRGPPRTPGRLQRRSVAARRRDRARAAPGRGRAGCRAARRGGISSRRRRRRPPRRHQMFSAKSNSARWNVSQPTASSATDSDDGDAERRPAGQPAVEQHRPEGVDDRRHRVEREHRAQPCRRRGRPDRRPRSRTSRR